MVSVCCLQDGLLATFAAPQAPEVAIPVRDNLNTYFSIAILMPYRLTYACHRQGSKA